MESEKKSTFMEIIRFLLIGGLATLCDYIVFYLFNLVILKSINPNTNLIISVFLGFVTGLIINWIFSAKFVFHYEKKTTNKQFITYVIICVIGLLITELGVYLASPLYETLYITFIVKFDFYKLLFKCLMTLIVLVWNYLGRKYIVFKK